MAEVRSMSGLVDCVIAGTIELPHSPPFLFEALLRSASEANLDVTTAQHEPSLIRGRLPTTLFFWGPQLTLQLHREGAERTLVSYEARATSRRPGQDERFREYIRARLSRLLRDAVALLEPQHVGV